MPRFDPYAAESATIEQAVPEYSMPRGTYAAPNIEEGDAYNDEFGWAAHLRTSAVEVPSAQRLGVIPRYDFYPDPQKPPERSSEQRDFDDKRRHSVEGIDADGWQELQGVAPGDQRWKPNPRTIASPDSRVTQSQSPANYSFTRPFDQLNRTYFGSPPSGSARTFNGWHFSMADNKRDYEAVGSMPVRSGRNTYRMEPQPWDANIVDIPPMQDVAVQVVQDYDLPARRSNSWRLT